MSGDQFAERKEALWRRHLPLVRERLAVVAAAGDMARANTLTEDARAAARQAAHQLAGTLDTYGRGGGSALARRAEDLLWDATPDTLADGLDDAVRQLRLMVEDGSAGSPPRSP